MMINYIEKLQNLRGDYMDKTEYTYISFNCAKQFLVTKIPRKFLKYMNVTKTKISTYNTYSQILTISAPATELSYNEAIFLQKLEDKIISQSIYYHSDLKELIVMLNHSGGCITADDIDSLLLLLEITESLPLLVVVSFILSSELKTEQINIIPKKTKKT